MNEFSKYCDTGDVGAVAARDTASWNKAVANSEVFCRSADEGMDARKLDVVSLLLFGSKTSQDGKNGTQFTEIQDFIFPKKHHVKFAAFLRDG